MRLPFLIITILITLISDGGCIYYIYSTGGHANWIYFPVFLAITYFAVYYFSYVICTIFNYDPHMTEKRIKEQAEYQKRKTEKEKKELEDYIRNYEFTRNHPELFDDNKKENHDDDDDDDSFTRSAAIGYLTDNPLLGGALGGSYSGGLFGSGLN